MRGKASGSRARLLPILLSVLVPATFSVAADAGDEGYPYHLLVGGKSASEKPATTGTEDESPELALVEKLDRELFPPPPHVCHEEPDLLGGTFQVADGGGGDLIDLVSSPLPSAPGTPVPLLDPDLSWMEGLVMPDLPVRWDDRVVVYLDRFRSDTKWRKILRSWLSRSERYGPETRRILAERGMPEDLQYLAMIESGYNPRARSSAGAVGLWQFMPATGDEYGLTRTKWVDQRRNPELSTVAAAVYLSRLHEMFGSWDLAMAAYNMGQGALLSSMKKYNTNDYWELADMEAGLPWGTSNYVPKILAAAIVGRNREAFGMGDIEYEDTIEYDVVLVPVSCKLSLVAKAAGADPDDVSALNPELVKDRVPPHTLPYPVRIPEGSAEGFEKGWEKVSSKLAPLETYHVKFGDTLTRIAKEHGTTVSEIAELNGIKKKDRIDAGDMLLVPMGPPPELPDADEEKVVAVPAVQFLYPGYRRVFYEIISGDTLGAIAVFFGVTVEDISIWNAVDPQAVIHPGMWLQIFVPDDRDLAEAVILEEDEVTVMEVGSEEFLDWLVEQSGRVRITYVVEEGDTLKSISKKFDVKISSIVRINQFGYTTVLEPGEEIVLYVDEEPGDNAGDDDGGQGQ